MSAHREQYPGGWQQLVARIQRLEDELAGLRQRALRVPVLDADADAANPANLWAFSDKRLRVRLDNGDVLDVQPSGDATTTVLRTYATNPSAASGVNLWLHGGTGELRARLANGTVQRFTPQVATTSSDSPTTAPPTTSSVGKPIQPQLKTYRTVHDATWTQSYDSDGQVLGFDVRFGRPPLDGPDTAKEKRAMVGFDDAALRAVLSGARITRVELWLSMQDTYNRDGVTAHVGTHAYASKPAEYGYRERGISSGHYGRTESRWRTIDTRIGRELAADVVRGIVLDQPSNSLRLYGRAKGIGSDGGGQPPRLRVTYVK